VLIRAFSSFADRRRPPRAGAPAPRQRAGGCANQVSVNGAWQDDVPHNQSFKRVLVVGVTHDLNQRCAFEHFLAARVNSESTVASRAATS